MVLKQRIIVVFVLLIILGCWPDDQSATKGSIGQNHRVAILSGHVIIDLPDDFKLMGEEMLAVKYPSNNRPTLVYTNESGSVNFAFNHTANHITKDQLPEFLQAFIQQFKSLYPQIKWIKKETTVVNGKSFIVMEFITPAIDTYIYNLMYVTELQGRMLMCSFNCTESQRAAWESKAKLALNSIAVK
jgi:hypothetical protein